MRKFLLFIIALGLFSCQGPMKKSIFETMTVQELKNEFEKDSLFEKTYKYVQLVKDSLLKSEIEQVKWADLTYSRLQSFVRFASDTSYFNSESRNLSNEWYLIYGDYLSKVDSISEYWKEYKSKNTIEQYVKIELVEIDKEYYTYSNDIKNVNLGFKLTPLKGKIDQMTFEYRIKPKLDEDDEDIESLLSVFNTSRCIMSRPFSKPTVRYWEVDYKHEKILESRNINSFLRDYNIYIEVDEIRKNGVNMSDDDLNIPKSVERYWEYENREYLSNFYAGDVIKELIFEDYIPEYEYIMQETQKILKEKDLLCFEFLELANYNILFYEE